MRVLEMSLPQELFPAGSIYNPLFEDDLDGASEKANQTVFLDRGGGTAVYIVTRWNGYSSATDDFELESRLVLSQTRDPFSDISHDVMPGADESIVYCGNGVKRCEMAARYSEYVVSFSADMNIGISANNFVEFCLYIDQKLSGVVRTSSVAVTYRP